MFFYSKKSAIGYSKIFTSIEWIPVYFRFVFKPEEIEFNREILVESFQSMVTKLWTTIIKNTFFLLHFVVVFYYAGYDFCCWMRY